MSARCSQREETRRRRRERRAKSGVDQVRAAARIQSRREGHLFENQHQREASTSQDKRRVSPDERRVRRESAAGGENRRQLPGRGYSAERGRTVERIRERVATTEKSDEQTSAGESDTVEHRLEESEPPAENVRRAKLSPKFREPNVQHSPRGSDEADQSGLHHRRRSNNEQRDGQPQFEQTQQQHTGDTEQVSIEGKFMRQRGQRVDRSADERPGEREHRVRGDSDDGQAGHRHFEREHRVQPGAQREQTVEGREVSTRRSLHVTIYITYRRFFMYMYI